MRESEQDNWKFGVVTFLDILGWKGIWERIGEDEALANLRELHSYLEDVKQTLNQPLESKKNHTILVISDTIVIFSEIGFEKKSHISTMADFLEHFQYTSILHDMVDMHGLICSEVISRSINLHIPVRGVTGIGKFILDNNTFLGPVVDEAAEWYDKADWIGVHLTPSAYFRLTSEFVFNEEELEHWVKYTPPHKTGTQWQSYCANWSKSWYTGQSDDYRLKNLIGVFKDMGPIGPDLVGKFTNTLDFFNKCISDTKSETNP